MLSNPGSVCESLLNLLLVEDACGPLEPALQVIDCPLTRNLRHPARPRTTKELSFWRQRLGIIQRPDADIPELVLDGVLHNQQIHTISTAGLYSTHPILPDKASAGVTERAVDGTLVIRDVLLGRAFRDAHGIFGYFCR